MATKHRLLEAAGAAFAEAGFAKTTVRDICERAGANLAAVNYHFRTKEALYAEVLTDAHRCALEQHPLTDARDESRPPEDRLRAFVRAFLARILDEGRPAWHGKLMSREMAEPTGALDRLVEESIRPQYELLSQIVRGMLGPDAAHPLVRRCVSSVVGQCLFYHFARPVIARLMPDTRLSNDEIAQLADHIAAFSIGAIRSLAGAGEADRS